jgi:2'-5' RNA ligase
VSDRARLFVALDLDSEVRRALVRWRDEFAPAIPGIRSVTMDALHVTLCFLGSRSLEEVDAIAAACAIRSAAPITGLRLGAATWLPRRHPRVLAATIEDNAGALAGVQSAIADALAAGGWYQREKRPFLAHVTVARVGGDRRSTRMPDPTPPPLTALADTAAVTLYRSHLSPRGSRYEALRVIRIDGGGKPRGWAGAPAA